MTTATSHIGQPNQPRTLWRNASFMLMWSSVAASGFGDRMIQLAAEPLLGVKEVGASGAAIQSSIMFFFLLPYMGMTLVGGWLADRVPRKWLMLACDEARALTLLVGFFMAGQLASTAAVPQEHRWKIFLIVALTGVFAAIFNPAKQSTMPQIVRSSDLQQANAVLAGIAIIASLLGVIAGGPVVENLSVQAGILIGVLAFGISGMFFAFLKIHRVKRPAEIVTTAAKRSMFTQTRITASFIWNHRSIRNLVLMNILFWSAVWFTNAAIAALVRHHYGIPLDEYLTHKSMMLGMVGIGMLIGSLIVVGLKTRRESDLMMLTSVVLAAVAMAGLAYNRSYAMGLALALIIGLFGAIFLVTVDTLTQTITPDFVRGRIFGFRALLNTVSGVLVNLAIWQLPTDRADKLMIPALATSSAVLGVIGIYGLLRSIPRGPVDQAMANVLWRVNRLFVFSWHRLELVGTHHIPKTGSAIITSNHTCAIDPMIIQAGSQRTIRWLMTRAFLFWWAKPLWRIINPIALEFNKGDRGRIRQIVEALEQGDVVGLFPEGGLQRDKRELQPFKPGIIMIARRSGAPIIPTWIEGTPQTRHMLWHFIQPSRSRVVFGKPYHLDENMEPEQALEDLKNRILELKVKS